MRSLTWKITLALILTSLLGVVFVAVFAGAFTRSRFDELRLAESRVQFIRDVSSYYRANGTLEGLADSLPQPDVGSDGDVGQTDASGTFNGDMQRGGSGWGRRDMLSNQYQLRSGLPLFFLVSPDGNVVTRAPGVNLGQRIPPREIARGEPLTVEGEFVGTIIEIGDPPEQNVLEQRFFAEVNRGLVLAALGVVLAASFVGVTLARRLTTPLRELTEAVRGMEAGKLEQRVESQSQDEIGDLVKSFNQMSAELSRANQLRRQMTADIAHDLRSPLAVITGYLEALSDGTLPPTPERFQTLHNEATLLQRLVEDLRTLSLVDAGELTLQREMLEIGDFLRDVQRFYETHAEAEDITIETRIAPNLPQISADRMRLGQVLGNLIGNALRHTPAGGNITLGAAQEGDSLHLWVQDTGEGIAPEKLPYIFDRLYRVDESRTQATGQTGLGLAITRALVEAHGGTIRAESQPKQGTTMNLWLPVAPSDAAEADF